MADDNTIIDGHVKFRDGKKWKSRWCVLRKLSPVADCIQMELYRESGGRRAAGTAAEALALQRVAALEVGFTLDKQSHTLAALSADLNVVLALPSQEALLQWQVKIEGVVGSGRQFNVAICGGAGALSGAARLHVRAARAALVAGTPPALLRHWPLQHLRRFGVIDGRLVIEGGSLCGAAGEAGGAVLALAADRADLLERELRAAAAALAATPIDPESPKSHRFPRPDTRQSEASLSRSHTTGDALYCGRDNWSGDAWPAADEDAGCGGRSIGLQRCVSCMSALGALTNPPPPGRPLAPPRPFQPAWCMRPVTTAPRAPHALDAAALSMLPAAEDVELRAAYDNYDVPRLHAKEICEEHYDTPRRLRARVSAGVVPRSATAGDLLHCSCTVRAALAPPAPVPSAANTVDLPLGAARESACSYVADSPRELYSYVDLSQKARRRNYENMAFVASLPHYENASDMLRRVRPSVGDYLVMGPAQAGYARMSPRAASSPALAKDPVAAGRRRAASVDSAASRESLSSTETLREVPPEATMPGDGRRRKPVAASNRDSSSSNDSGVSVCGARGAGCRRRARSAEARDPLSTATPTHTSRSAEAEVPILSIRPLRGAGDAHSTSSGASDLSDYIETLSLCSSHSSTDTPHASRARAGALGSGGSKTGARECAAVLRPRSGNEYRRLLPACAAPRPPP